MSEEILLKVILDRIKKVDDGLKKMGEGIEECFTILIKHIQEEFDLQNTNIANALHEIENAILGKVDEIDNKEKEGVKKTDIDLFV